MFISLSVLGLVFVPLGGQGLVLKQIKLHFDMYTGPAYFSALLAIINMILMAVFFREYRLTDRKKTVQKMTTINPSEGE